MKKKILAIVCASIMLAGCGAGNNTENTENTEQTTQVEQTGESTPPNLGKVESARDLPQLQPMKAGEQIATIKTNKGDIVVRFFPENAPKAVENFIGLAEQDKYDGVVFHRVIDNFMIQGGDYENGNGTGGQSIWGKEFENETSLNLRHFRGALSMANAGPDTNGSQFFIVQNPTVDDALLEEMKTIPDNFPQAVADEYAANGGTPSLDFGYSVFGQVIEGMEVVDEIASVETDDSDRPVEDVIIEDVEISEYSE